MARKIASNPSVPGTGGRSPASGPRIIARKSPIHGRGVFARRDIAKGERIKDGTPTEIISDAKVREVYLGNTFDTPVYSGSKA